MRVYDAVFAVTGLGSALVAYWVVGRLEGWFNAWAFGALCVAFTAAVVLLVCAVLEQRRERL